MNTVKIFFPENNEFVTHLKGIYFNPGTFGTKFLGGRKMGGPSFYKLLRVVFYGIQKITLLKKNLQLIQTF